MHRQSPKNSQATLSTAQSRLNRKNHAKQVQTQKRHALVSATRLFNGIDGTPRIVAVVPLAADVDARQVAASLGESLDVAVEDIPQNGLWKLKCVNYPSLFGRVVERFPTAQSRSLQNICAIYSASVQATLRGSGRLQGRRLRCLRSFIRSRG